MEVATKKALINAQLVCAFVFAYTCICKSRFSYDAAQIMACKTANFTAK